MALPPRVIWTVSDGRRGIDAQALGLAQALNRIRPGHITRKIIGSESGFARLPPCVQLLRRARPSQYSLAAPYGDIVIGCGRQAIAPLRSLKKTNPKSFVIYIQDPRGSYNHFDLIIAPEHDGLNRKNTIAMIGSPNQITAVKLAEAREKFAKQLAAYPAPRAAFLIGGPSKQRRITPQITAQHIQAAQNLITQGYCLLVTLSRRTDEPSRHAWSKLAAAHEDKIWLYGGDGSDAQASDHENPYMAFLAASNLIGVTEESTNMLTEACASGAAIFRLPMEGAPGKFQTLYDSLAVRCQLRPFKDFADLTPTVDAPSYEPLFETERIAQLIDSHYEEFRAKAL